MRAMTFAAVAALVLTAGCGNGGSAVETRDREAEVQAAAASGGAPSAPDAGSDASSGAPEAWAASSRRGANWVKSSRPRAVHIQVRPDPLAK